MEHRKRGSASPTNSSALLSSNEKPKTPKASAGIRSFPGRLNKLVLQEKLSPPTPSPCIIPSVIPASHFTEQFQRASPPSNAIDLTAKLVCVRKEDGHWDSYLTAITGNQVTYLLGRTFHLADKLPLNDLLPPRQQADHQLRLENILNEGPNSIYWNSLFQTMFNRTIKIVNPHDQTPRLVSIHMSVDASKEDHENTYVFNTTLTDKTAINSVADTAGLLTHDLRTLWRSVITVVKEEDESPTFSSYAQSREAFMASTPQELSCLYDLINARENRCKEQYGHLHAIASDGMAMCAPSREDFMPQMTSDSALSVKYELVSVSVRLNTFVEKQRMNVRPFAYTLSLSDRSSVQLESRKMDLLERFLLNLVKNSLETRATEIAVICSNVSEASRLFLNCEISDNGPGIPESLLSTFFTRSMPARSPHRKIEEKRGEGTLMANAQWEAEGGTVTVSNRTNGTTGAQFNLRIPAHPPLFFKKEEATSCPLLQPEHIKQLHDVMANMALQGLVMLVDDTVLNLKLLMRKITAILFPGELQQEHLTKLNQVTRQSWPEIGLTVDTLGGWGIVCAANGSLAFEIVKLYPLMAMITDEHMPGNMQGTHLINATRELEQQKRLTPMHLALHTGLPLDDLDADKKRQLKKHDVTYILKGHAHSDLLNFFSKVGLLVAETNAQAHL